MTPSQVQAGEDRLAVDLSWVPQDSVLLLIAKAIPDWMFQHVPAIARSFWAVPHAVASLPPDVHTRTVYGRMRIAPLDAVPLRQPEQGMYKTPCICTPRL